MLRAAAEADPDNHEIHHQAGECLARLGNQEAALGAFQQAARIRPDWPAPYLGAARSLVRQGDAYAGIQTLLHVLGIAPGHLEATQQLAGLLARLKPDKYLSALEPALLACFAQQDIDPSPLAGLCGQQLRLGFAERFGADAETTAEDGLEYLAGSDLWHHYLSRVINTEPRLEVFLTRLRRHLCSNRTIKANGGAPVNLIAALAQQCFLKEYVFAVSDEEAARLETVQCNLEDASASSDSGALAFALSCLYQPPRLDPSMGDDAEALCEDHPWLADLCRLTVFEPLEEARIAEELFTLHPVHREASLKVQAQYEVNPYPRWHVPPAPQKSALVHDIRRRFSSRPFAESGSDEPRILVAGCGTGFEPIDIARRDSSVAITALDLSRRSLAYARRQAEALGCTNIEFWQGDILDLPETNWVFDVIVCTGVLHHMADPLQGWRVLRDRLTPTGVMRIALYSAHARQPIRAARDYIRTQGIADDSDGIRDFRQSILGDSRHPDLAVLLHSDDFYSMSGCRDLLFHVQEQHFTLPQIQSALGELDLQFCGFDPADTSILRRFAAEYPDTGALLNLDNWDRFERANPGVFSAMYQFWCEPDDGEKQ